MPIDFPPAPTTGATYTYGGKTYRYGGVYWSAVNLANQINQTSFQASVVAAWYEVAIVSGATPPTVTGPAATLNYL